MPKWGLMPAERAFALLPRRANACRSGGAGTIVLSGGVSLPCVSPGGHVVSLAVVGRVHFSHQCNGEVFAGYC